ncbi:MAG: 50S ribosomal protein L18 [Thermoplasmata archaeon]|nr:50S ribosomal protein L18 [Thermoplasmata archaeon]
MSRGPRFRVPFRRRREGRTDYRHRLALLRSGEPRAVVRLTHHRVVVALTSYDPTGDRVIAAAESPELLRIGFPTSGLASTPASYLTGYLAGLRAKSSGTVSAVLDLGLRRPATGGRLWGAVKGLVDAGIDIPHGEGAFPSNDRLAGTHLAHRPPEPIESYRGKLPGVVPRTKEKAA